MFEYGPTAAEVSGGDARSLPLAVAARDRAAAPLAAAGASDHAAAILAAARRRKGLIVACAIVCGLAGFAASKLLTPRYVAVAQIYVDPGGLPGAAQDVPAPGQDSNGFINYVESQSLIIASHAVLDRVVADNKLEDDPDLVGGSIFSTLLGSAPPSSDRGAAAAAALAARIRVKRPERTFVIDLSVADRDPKKAAELANATARAYIEVSSSWQSDVSRRTEKSLADRLESLRARVIEAEKKVEDYKAANGLVGTRDQLVAEQQLKDMTAQMMAARNKAAEAHARLEQIQSAHKRGDIAAIASQIVSPSLSALRGQQGLAHQRLADLTAELGSRHPDVIDAKARVAAADAAVEAELARIGKSLSIEYDGARQLEASLGRQLDQLKTQANENGQSAVGLRDLERQADASRALYELFVTRSRETGEIQQVEPARSRIISLATPPKFRSFPPSASLMTAAGLLLGLALGVAGSVGLERRGTPEPAKTPGPPGPGPRASDRTVSFAITPRSRLEIAQRRQSLDELDIAGLGFPALPHDADGAEFDAILDALALDRAAGADPPRALSFAVVGPNGAGLRTALAINLSLCVARRGARVALVDACERNARLTRAVRHAAHTPILKTGAFYSAADGILLALPKGFDAEIGRIRADEVLRSLARLSDEAVDIVICDGPDPGDDDAARILGLVDEVVALEAAEGEDGEPSVAAALNDAGVTARALVRFDAGEGTQRKPA